MEVCVWDPNEEDQIVFKLILWSRMLNKTSQQVLIDLHMKSVGNTRATPVWTVTKRIRGLVPMSCHVPSQCATLKYIRCHDCFVCVAWDQTRHQLQPPWAHSIQKLTLYWEVGPIRSPWIAESLRRVLMPDATMSQVFMMHFSGQQRPSMRMCNVHPTFLGIKTRQKDQVATDVTIRSLPIPSIMCMY